MSENRKIEVISNCKATVSLNVPHLHLKKEWPKKGAKVLIDYELLAEAFYDPGVEYMFKQGILYMKDKEAMVELGLMDAESEEMEYVVMTDVEKEEYMSSKRQSWELKKALEKLSYEGRKHFCDYVVEHELLDSKKSTVISEICDFDVLHAIQMKRANEG